MSKANTMTKSNTMSKTKTMNNSDTMSKTMSNSNTMSKSKTMSYSNTMSKANPMSNNSGMSNWMSNWISNSVSIGSNTIIGNISNISIIIIGMVVDMLDTSIRKVDRVGSLNNTGAIIGLSLVEGSTRVVISNSIGVGVGRYLSKVRLGISTTSMVSNSMSKSMTKSNTNTMAKTMS